MTDEEKAVELLIGEIVSGAKSILSLDLDAKKDRAIAIKCLEKLSSLCSVFDASVPEHVQVLTEWVAKDYTRIASLRNDQLHKDIVEAYLKGKFSVNSEGINDLSVIRSFDNKILLLYYYKTKEGEAVTYFDRKIGMPISLNTSAFIKVKISDALRMVKKIDIALTRVDLKTTVDLITSVITRALRICTTQLIDEMYLDYYELLRNIPTLNDRITAYLNSQLGGCGFELDDFTINGMTIPAATDELMQRQFFALAEAERINSSETKMEMESLKVYEAKAAIHQKYPEFPFGLTEKEKDFALNRYIKKQQMGGQTYESDIDIATFDKREKKSVGTATQIKLDPPVKPIPPTTATDNKALVRFIVMSVIAAGLACCGFISSAMLGCILLSAVVVLSIVLGLAFRKKLDPKKKQQDAQAKYQQELDLYNIKLKEYNEMKEKVGADEGAIIDAELKA